MFDRENSLWVKYNFDISNVYYKEKWKFLYFAFNTNVTNQPLMLSNSTVMNDSLEYAVGVDTTIYDTIKLIKWFTINI